MKKTKNDIVTIRILGRRLGLMSSAIRYYEKLGLIKLYGRSRGNRRLYREKETAARIQRIIELKADRLYLSEIKTKLDKEFGGQNGK